MSNDLALERLRTKFPWPEKRPDAAPIDWNMNAGGRELVIDVIRRRNVRVVLEIGVFVGGSTKTWLDASPDVVVIAVDHWPGTWEASYARQCGRSRRVINQLSQKDGSYHAFLSSLWDSRDRVIPVRGESPGALEVVHQTGVSVDLVYLDADKSGRELEICRRLFPHATISGDDWWCGIDHWWRPDDGYRIRKPVKEFCRRHGFYLKTSRHTWLIDRDPPSLRDRLKRPGYHFKVLRHRVRGLFRGALGLDKAA
jgi:hypothetical protein